MGLKIGVVGLGKLGLCSALCFAKAGFQVRGFDTSEKVIESIKKKKIIIKEPEVIKYLHNYNKNI